MISLKEARNKKNKTQEEVAKAAEITLRHYIKIEKGESIPTVKVAIKICRFLQTDIYEISEWN